MEQPQIEPNKSLIEEIEKERNSRLITYVFRENTLIDDSSVLPLYDQLKEIGKTEKIDLFLSSLGGFTEVPVKLVGMIREYCKHFSVIVPYKAHSAATHIALGSDEIVMGPLSELSPVDPKRSHPLLPKNEKGTPIAVSVQELKDYLKFIRQEVEKGDSKDKEGEVYERLAEYIHPLALGAIEQSYNLARLVTKKVLETHMDPVSCKKQIDDIIEKLSSSYQSHNYPISAHEAKENLGLPVVLASENLWDRIWTLYQYYLKQFSLKYQNEKDQSLFKQNSIFIDSVNFRAVLSHTFRVEDKKIALVKDQSGWTKVGN